MPSDRFLIAPLDKGLQNDVRPWLIPDEAYQELNNAYLFRSRIRKRFGERLLTSSQLPMAGFEQIQSRLRINVGTITSGSLSGFVPGAIFQPGQMFSVGNNFYTVTVTGTPGNLLRSDGVVALAQFNTTSGAFTLNGVPVADGVVVYFYPATPVMGLLTYESVPDANSPEPTIAFDTQFAYEYGATGWERISAEATPGASVWTGSDTQFFWSTTYKGNASSDRIFYVSNFNQTDGLRYYDGLQWDVFDPAINSAAPGDFIMTARMIVTFKDRLLLINTVESISSSATPYVNRCRFSQNGSPLAADAWLQDIPGKGSYLDCPTAEAAVSAEFIKDRLIVYFQRSTWELAYTGNQVLPFVWQKINTEFGAESTFSVVPFDKVAFSIDSIGILACNGANVERIDQLIPDEVFKVNNDEGGPDRVYGIRDYQLEMVYWTFPNDLDSSRYPNRVLVYNYRTNSWSYNDDSITCFGYFQASEGLTWAAAEMVWGEADFEWNSYEYQPLERSVIAGNQNGYTFIVEGDTPRNAPGMQISNITITNGGDNATITSYNNNLIGGEYVLIESCIGVNGFNGNIFQVDVVAPDFSSFTIQGATPGQFTGTYLGGGVVTLVSQIDILTKQYNFYTQAGYNVSLSKVDFMIDRSDTGAMTVDAYISSTTLSTIQDGTATGALIGTNVLETYAYPTIPIEGQQARLWHPVYFQVEGECVQLRIYLSPSQMLNPDYALEDFQMHAFMIYAQRTSSRFQ